MISRRSLPAPATKKPPPPRKLSQAAQEEQWRRNSAAVRGDIDVAKISLRHDLPLVGWTVVIRFRDRPNECFPVQARDPLTAARLTSYTSERSWSAEKCLAVESIHPVRE